MRGCYYAISIAFEVMQLKPELYNRSASHSLKQFNQ